MVKKLPNVKRGSKKLPVKKINLKKVNLKKFDWKKIGIYGGLGILAVLMLVQIFYPGNRMLPFASVDGVGVGFNKRDEAVKKLNDSYDQHKFVVYLGKSEKKHSEVSLKTAGIKVDNTERLNKLNYPWYIRLIPTSIFWAHAKKTDVPHAQFTDNYEKYLSEKLMPVCSQDPVDASLKYQDGKLVLVESKMGGECEEKLIDETMKKIRPNLQTEDSVRIALKEIEPQVQNDEAKNYGKELTERVGDGVPLTVGAEVINVPANEILSWMDFASVDGDIAYSLNAEKAGGYLDKNIAPKVTIAAGVSHITTKDFDIVSSQIGPSGQALNNVETIRSLEGYINQTSANAQAITRAVPPRINYTRTYSSSDAGLNALLENYAKDHDGTFGISFAELSGKKRRANYNGDKQFVTASTYKLFVGYSVLKRVDAGTMDWATNETCFNRMIINSDNPCAEDFLNNVGLRTVTNEMKDLGLTKSNFTQEGGPFTTANDQVLFMGMLESGQSLNGVSRDRFLSALRQNVYRRGIPAGVNGAVANKVGFMDGLLHDTAIVYSPNGTYVLSILTDGSSWATIADLAKEIDALRAQ